MSTPPEDEPGGPPLLAGRYELGTTLGRGGMADVYRAVDRVLSRPVAVKILRETAAGESDRARFVAEARTLARLSHSGLVTVMDAGFGPDVRTAATAQGRPPSAVTPEDQPFLVMELVDGPSLAQAIADGPLPLDEAGSIGVQVAEALAYVHAHGVIHRDVKPGNVLLGREQVKLADFGIARLLGDTSRHTRTGQAIGTAAYLAPEQVTGQDVSGVTDVYSLGLVLLEAITGRLEYPGPAAEAAVVRLNRPPRVPDHVPVPWRELLTEMTALEPADRPGAGEVAERLRDQPTGPVPVATEGTPDARTVPLLTPAPGGAAHETRVLTEPTPAAEPRPLAGRLRALTPSQRGVIGAIAALVLVLLVVAVVGNGDPGSSEIPSNTPAELREPLQELHRAVHGDDG